MEKFETIGKDTRELIPRKRLHPGYVINDEIEARGLKKSAFAKIVGLSPSQLSELLKGKRHVSEDLALRLEKALDIDAEFWMRVQVKYNLDKKRLEYAQNSQVMGVSEPEVIYKKIKQKKEK
jgi:addiction module HigA family antidote